MQAVILAAGIGSRLRPITLDRPKCCVTVDATPILAHQLRAYAEAGVDRVYVGAGYMANRLRECCSDVALEYPEVDIVVRENEAFANTDNLYSLYQFADDVAGEPFLLSNGDVVFDADALTALRSSPAASAIACDRRTYSAEGMKIVVDDDGYVTHISKEIDATEAYATSIDVYRFSRAFSERLFDEIERLVEIEEGYTNWTEVAIDRVLEWSDHGVEPADIGGARWVEIDDHDDLLEADLTFSSLSDLRTKDAVFFDLDGTLYLDDALVDGAAQLVDALRGAGTAVYFLSNNSSGWKTGYAEKLSDLGVPARPEDVILSTDGVIDYLNERGIDAAYVVGTATMRAAIRDRGIEPAADDPEAVVVGFDTELTYEKVRRATLAVRDGAEFLLAHPDAVCPTSEGFVPDCGAIGALVETATDRPPGRVFGKPSPEMIAHVVESRGLCPEDIAIVGDRLETDIRLAERLGCESVCVLTGDADRATVEVSAIEPTLVVGDVGDIPLSTPRLDPGSPTDRAGIEESD